MLDDALLYAHQAGIAHFHAQVAARDHDAVADLDDGVHGTVIGHGFGTFDLGDDPGFAARFLNQLARFLDVAAVARKRHGNRSEEHTSELQSLMRISYAVFCLKKKKTILSTHARRTNTTSTHTCTTQTKP